MKALPSKAHSKSIVEELRGADIGQFRRGIEAARTAFDDGRRSGLTMKQRGEAMRRYSEALRKHAGLLEHLAECEAGAVRGSQIMGPQVHIPLRMTHEIIDMFLTLPEHEENPM